LAGLLSIEGLARPAENGQMQPWLAEKWMLMAGGRSVRITLRANVKFHDGTPLRAAEMATLLPEILRSFMGPVYAEVESVKAVDQQTIDVAFRHASPLLYEALEATVRKPAPTVIGTGPFAVVGGSTTDMTANADYYLGRPEIDRIHVEAYPNVRAAWADMLRDRLDMLWEVGSEALDSMKDSTTVSLFTYTRHYQHVVVFNTKAPALRSASVRQALSLAIDRGAVVRDALRNHGVASSGPVAPRYWALPSESPQFDYDPQRAATLLGRSQGHTPAVHFTCLVSADSVAERIALDVKHQLAAVGVDMAVEEAPRDELMRRAGAGEYEAAVTEVISGPTLLRPYLIWRSGSPVNWGRFGSASIDAALDRVRYAESEDEYRRAVIELQRAFMDDPPAIFLAWSVSTRAISKRFDVQAEEGRDVLSTVRFWKPAADQRQASRN
jgi:peptide/nickel transport system substrate-binding protein